jgi:predicted metal-dependent hydrolase
MADPNQLPDWLPDFERGVILFNGGRFFDCHEVWEVAWQQASGADKIRIQTLIQAAVALLHLERGNLRGAQSVWAKAHAKFQTHQGELLGFKLDGFCAALERLFSAAREGHAMGQFPRLQRPIPNT